MKANAFLKIIITAILSAAAAGCEDAAEDTYNVPVAKSTETSHAQQSGAGNHSTTEPAREVSSGSNASNRQNTTSQTTVTTTTTTSSSNEKKPAAAPAQSAGDAVSFGSLNWSYGGINGSGASKTSATIKNLSISGRTLSYSWGGTTLSSWGLSDSNAGAFACLFVKNKSGAWVGGKFDWISTSRTTRDLENVLHGYSGWSLANVPNPCQAAFVIVSSDRKKRTNVISCSWKR